MKHTSIIQHVIEVVSLYGGILKGKFTPSEYKPLVKDNNGEPESGMFIYSSAVGMLLYIYLCIIVQIFPLL